MKAIKDMLKKDIKSEYEAPQVEVFGARVERGFAGSQPDEPAGSTLDSWGAAAGESQFS